MCNFTSVTYKLQQIHNLSKVPVQLRQRRQSLLISLLKIDIPLPLINLINHRLSADQIFASVQRLAKAVCDIPDEILPMSQRAILVIVYICQKTFPALSLEYLAPLPYWQLNNLLQMTILNSGFPSHISIWITKQTVAVVSASLSA